VSTTKLNKTWNILLRLVIVVVALFFIYYQVFSGRDIVPVLEFFNRVSEGPLFYASIALFFLLMLLNLSLEAIKWRLLIGKIEQINFYISLTAVFTGISVSMFLPNRMGDYLGRVFMLKHADRLKAILVTIIGSIAQLLITLFAGTMAMIILAYYLIDLSNFVNRWLYVAAVLIALGFLALSLSFYFNIQAIKPLLSRLFKKWQHRIESYVHVFTQYTNRNLLEVLLLSLLRYLVFSFQFYLLLLMFEVPVPYLHAMALIALSYLLISVIPTIALSELGIRGSLTIYLFGQYFAGSGVWSENMALAVLAASTGLWLLNIAFPALLGVLFVYRLKFFNKSKSNDI
jgi:uncharacterized membrane protein YbhN (UPF0104 family)